MQIVRIGALLILIYMRVILPWLENWESMMQSTHKYIYVYTVSKQPIKAVISSDVPLLMQANTSHLERTHAASIQIWLSPSDLTPRAQNIFTSANSRRGRGRDVIDVH